MLKSVFPNYIYNPFWELTFRISIHSHDTFPTWKWHGTYATQIPTAVWIKIAHPQKNECLKASAGVFCQLLGCPWWRKHSSQSLKPKVWPFLDGIENLVEINTYFTPDLLPNILGLRNYLGWYLGFILKHLKSIYKTAPVGVFTKSLRNKALIGIRCTQVFCIAEVLHCSPTTVERSLSDLALPPLSLNSVTPACI